MMRKLRPNVRSFAALAVVALLGVALAGCATYYPAGGDRGVYYEVPEYRPSRAAYIDPFAYPYWSLDYFYYSRYYHPYSVVVHRFDPWYYPYPGWYYGYWPGPRFAGHPGRFHYPWYRYGHRYPGYRPWRSGSDLSFGDYRDGRHDGRHRVRELDRRLHDVEIRRSLALREFQSDRQLTPGAAPWLPASSRGSAVRRNDSPPPRHDGRGDSDGARGSREHRALIERLRAGGRGADLPERNVRHRDLPSVTAPAPRDGRARRDADFEPAPSARPRSSMPTTPRSRPQRSPAREPSPPTRSQPRSRRDEPERQ